MAFTAFTAVSYTHLDVYKRQLSVSGLAMCGSDIGGFGSDTTPELLVRFYEAAVFRCV